MTPRGAGFVGVSITGVGGTLTGVNIAISTGDNANRTGMDEQTCRVDGYTLLFALTLR